ncbi:Cyclin-dependent kinase inhibitor 4 [Linum perenne]
MGRYMGKAKRTGHVAGMDLSLGVRTRAKTLALLRLQQQQQTTPKLHVSPLSCPPPDAATASAGYLQLRSRRLEKSPVLLYGSNRRHSRHAAVVDQLAACGNPNPNPNSNPVHESDSSGVKDQERGRETTGEIKHDEEVVQQLNDQVKDSNQNRDLAVEVSFGENCLDNEARDSESCCTWGLWLDCGQQFRAHVFALQFLFLSKFLFTEVIDDLVTSSMSLFMLFLDRSTRESTPCSLIRDPETIRAPGSTSRPTCSNNASTRMQNSVSRRIPTAREMDEFFAGAEDEQVKQFIDKYNFDPVNEKPLPPGRYEWEKLDP